jgi:crotonobetainyl-CoA:carnitine CoA-transferase CaiB-like acyl-CoA transferase
MPSQALLAPVVGGLIVFELGHFVAAPFCARLLGELGADVIKIAPCAGDPARQWGETVGGRSLWWFRHGRNKRSVTVDLKTKEGHEIVLKLVADTALLDE